MTQYPEAYLARELGICYASIALITDYDVGRRGHRRHRAGHPGGGLRLLRAQRRPGPGPALPGHRRRPGRAGLRLRRPAPTARSPRHPRCLTRPALRPRSVRADVAQRPRPARPRGRPSRRTVSAADEDRASRCADDRRRPIAGASAARGGRRSTCADWPVGSVALVAGARRGHAGRRSSAATRPTRSAGLGLRRSGRRGPPRPRRRATSSARGDVTVRSPARCWPSPPGTLAGDAAGRTVTAAHRGRRGRSTRPRLAPGGVSGLAALVPPAAARASRCRAPRRLRRWRSQPSATWSTSSSATYVDATADPRWPSEAATGIDVRDARDGGRRADETAPSPSRSAGRPRAGPGRRRRPPP